jgi:hypothetical protein
VPQRILSESDPQRSGLTPRDTLRARRRLIHLLKNAPRLLEDVLDASSGFWQSNIMKRQGSTAKAVPRKRPASKSVGKARPMAPPPAAWEQ